MSLGLVLPYVVLTILLGTEQFVYGGGVTPSGEPASVPVAVNQEDTSVLLHRELAEGEALVWHLGHCGWAVKTRSRMLIFDYWEQHPTGGERSLAVGRINPTEIADLDIFVFVTHGHGDHFDPVILEWANAIPNITYVFGWDASLGPSFNYLTEPRAVRSFGNLDVLTVNHEFDNIPEVAYLVNVDGLIVYHSGDHASTSEVPNQIFVDNIDYFSSKQDRVDLAFISIFGRRGGITVNAGDLYTIERLRAKVVFPMHHGGGEDLNQRFVDAVAREFPSVDLLAARQPGDRFLYADGRAQRDR